MKFRFITNRKLLAIALLLCCLVVCFSFAAKLTQYSSHPHLVQNISASKMHVTTDGGALLVVALPFAGVLLLVLASLASRSQRLATSGEAPLLYRGPRFGVQLFVRPPPAY